MQEKGARKEQGEVFVVTTSMNVETRPIHICAIELAAHIFSS